MTDYASLINKLDIEAETRIMEDLSKEDAINNRREQFINQIKQIENRKLTNLDILNKLAETSEEELLNGLIFKNEFCFLVERKKALIGYLLFVSSVYVDANKMSMI